MTQTDPQSEVETPHVYKMWEHRGWGNKIEWAWGENPTRVDVRKCAGNLRRRPKVGDRLLARATDGTEHEFEFTHVELLSNPPDMFFATVNYVRPVPQAGAV